MAISATASKKETQFLWEGKDKRGHKVRGKALAANEQALRADLRRQGVARHQSQDPEQNARRREGSAPRYSGVLASARDYDVGGHTHGSGL